MKGKTTTRPASEGSAETAKPAGFLAATRRRTRGAYPVAAPAWTDGVAPRDGAGGAPPTARFAGGRRRRGWNARPSAADAPVVGRRGGVSAAGVQGGHGGHLWGLRRRRGGTHGAADTQGALGGPSGRRAKSPRESDHKSVAVARNSWRGRARALAPAIAQRATVECAPSPAVAPPPPVARLRCLVTPRFSPLLVAPLV